MTKDELPLIEDWIRYHGHLFGFANLYIIDGSTDQRVLEVYERYRGKGLNLIRSEANLNDLAAEITRVMHEFKGDGSFLIKLDTDEFLAYRSGEGGAPFANRGIRALFDFLPVSGQKYKASYTVRSVPQEGSFESPARELTTFGAVTWSEMKSFFHSEGFVSVDLGCHRGETEKDEGFIPTALATIHYHSISMEDCVRRARQVLVSHGYLEEGDDEPAVLEKLEALLERVRVETPEGVEYHTDSFHRIMFYLDYLRGDGDDAGLGDRRFNNFYLDAAEEGERVEVTLVRDTLRELDGKLWARLGDPNSADQRPDEEALSEAS